MASPATAAAPATTTPKKPVTKFDDLYESAKTLATTAKELCAPVVALIADLRQQVALPQEVTEMLPRICEQLVLSADRHVASFDAFFSPDPKVNPQVAGTAGGWITSLDEKEFAEAMEKMRAQQLWCASEIERRFQQCPPEGAFPDDIKIDEWKRAPKAPKAPAAAAKEQQQQQGPPEVHVIDVDSSLKTNSPSRDRAAPFPPPPPRQSGRVTDLHTVKEGKEEGCTACEEKGCSLCAD
jgi:hypothetical protein